MNMEPPQIFIGENKSLAVAMPNAEKALLLTLITPIGEFDITIFLKENRF